MAKDLPYFKFFCSEWNDGDITLEDYNIQGLFINVCSYYWSNECYVSIDKLLKRFRHDQESINYLIKIGIMHNENGYLEVNFLDEQKADRDKTSKKNAEAGKKSAEKRRLAKIERESNQNSTSVEITLNETATKSQPLREEKRREEKKREELKGAFKNAQEFIDGFNKAKGKATGTEGRYRVMSKTDKNNFKILNNAYTRKDFNHAIKMMAASEWVRANSMFTIAHFLVNDNFNKYLNQTSAKKMAQGLIEGN